MRENRQSGSEGGAGANPLFLPLSKTREVGRVPSRGVLGTERAQTLHDRPDSGFISGF